MYVPSHFEMTVGRVEGKAKLSQNRTEADRAAVAAALLGGDDGDRRVGEMMR